MRSGQQKVDKIQVASANGLESRAITGQGSINYLWVWLPALRVSDHFSLTFACLR